MEEKESLYKKKFTSVIGILTEVNCNVMVISGSKIHLSDDFHMYF